MAEQRPIHITPNTKAVLGALLDSPEGTWGLQIVRDARISSGMVYSVLHRLEDHAWIESRWEQNAPPPRKPRRYWKLTTWGARWARDALGRHSDA